jgi:YesN/AraC family two-component response regulator
MECYMVSAHEDASLAAKCIELGARDYLIKPISRHTLLSILESAE